MSVSKSQGQTLRTAGLDLTEKCFSHEQLYVACSRVNKPKEFLVFEPHHNGTANMLYKEVLEE